MENFFGLDRYEGLETLSDLNFIVLTRNISTLYLSWQLLSPRLKVRELSQEQKNRQNFPARTFVSVTNV